jgi:hypothetical protein
VYIRSDQGLPISSEGACECLHRTMVLERSRVGKGGAACTVLYSTRDQTVRFAYVNNLRAEGKQTHILCKPKTLPTKELRQRATKCFRWEIMFSFDQYMLRYLLPSHPSDPLTFYF